MVHLLFIGGAVANAIQEHNDFIDSIAKLSPEERQAALDRRQHQREEERRERERKEMIEAMKPHNLWSFLGLGSK